MFSSLVLVSMCVYFINICVCVCVCVCVISGVSNLGEYVRVCVCACVGGWVVGWVVCVGAVTHHTQVIYVYS